MRIPATLIILALVGCGPSATTPAKVDNAAVNQRDRSKETKTPIDQNENTPDLKTTASIRQRLQKEEISVNAKNVKIITQDGSVTLRGPVASQAEKDLVDKIAKEIAGDAKVDNQLEIKE